MIFFFLSLHICSFPSFFYDTLFFWRKIIEIVFCFLSLHMRFFWEEIVTIVYIYFFFLFT